MTRLSGIAVSPGVAWGPAAVLLQHPLTLRYAVAPEQVARELARLEHARALTRRQLEGIHARVLAASGPDLAYLFQAQLLMLDDQLLVPRARTIVSTERLNAEAAVQRAFDEFCAIFMDAGDSYLRERRGDIADVVGRLQRNLTPAPHLGGDVLLSLDEASILVADDLAPSFAGQLDRRRVLGLALDGGSRTDHCAILARSLRLPAVASLGAAAGLVRPGCIVLVDGYAGEIVIDPDPDVIERARAKRARKLVTVPVSQDLVRPTTTTDGVPVRFEANIELPDEIDVARANGAEGIGLFRSEFMLGSQSVDTVDEESQYLVYRDLVARMAPHPVTVRTFDVDEGRVQSSDPARPADGLGDVSRGPLGLRAIRLSLQRRDIFATQLRALARAAAHGPIRVLFPFVSSVEELREARIALFQARDAVTPAGSAPADIPVGAMIEVPSAALTVDLLAGDADFFSIGTNDLIQYCLAVDRTDGRVARLYEPLHPAIVRVIRHVTRVASRSGRPVAICGEMASDPAALLVLLGLGVTTFSMSPAAIPAAREVVRQVSLAKLRRTTARALRLSTAHDIVGSVAAEYPSLVPRTQKPGQRPGAEGDNGER